MRRKRFWGYTDIGPITIPPRPPFIVMTDRSSGFRYVLTIEADAFALSQTLPSSPNTIYFGPYEGPYINGNIRLYIEGGGLNGEIVADASAYYNQRVLARVGNSKDCIEVTAGTDWAVGDAFTYDEVTLDEE